MVFIHIRMEEGSNMNDDYNDYFDEQEEADKYLDAGAAAYRDGDYRIAKELYEKALDLGSVQAACNLGYIYAYGRTGEQDDEKAFYYFNLAAADGNPNGLYKVGDAYYWGNFVSKNPKLAFKYYRNAEMALDDGDDDLKSDIYYRLALCLFNGVGIEATPLLALSYIDQAHTYSYIDRFTRKFAWESLADKIEKLRKEIILELDREYKEFMEHPIIEEDEY